MLGVLMYLAATVALGADEQVDLEKWILSTLATNDARYKKGSLTATALSRSDYTQHTADVYLAWDGPPTYWDYTYIEGHFDRTVEPPRLRIAPERKVRALERDGELWCYFVSSDF